MIVMPTGSSAPDPRPCTARETMSCVISLERPAPTEPATNTAMPATYIGVRPKMSASRPMIGVATVDTSRYAENTSA